MNFLSEKSSKDEHFVFLLYIKMFSFYRGERLWYNLLKMLNNKNLQMKLKPLSCLKMYSMMIRINLTIAIIDDPKANEPT